MPTVRLNRTLVLRHAAGRSDTYDAALLDIAQDHLLWLLVEVGMFERHNLIFKGGTSLRKCRLGGAGRFSTDVDFAAPDDDTVLAVCEVIDGATISGFRFSLAATRGDGRHWNLTADHPELGRPAIGASIEFARRPLVLPPERLPAIPLPVHKAYDVILPALPVIAEAEACAEKLARYRRIALGRDLYDLAQFAGRPINERLVRRLWVLKVWTDVIDDKRGSGPLDPDDVLTSRGERDFAPDSIGALTRPVELAQWERRVRQRFSFLTNLDQHERRWASCDPRHRNEIHAALSNQGFPSL